jgi:hypothetical protein
VRADAEVEAQVVAVRALACQAVLDQPVGVGDEQDAPRVAGLVAGARRLAGDDVEAGGAVALDQPRLDRKSVV